MEKLTILVDMDDVIEGLGTAWVEYLNNRFGTDEKWENIDDWNIEKFFPGRSAEDIYYPLMCDWFWNAVKPLPGAVEYLKRLQDDGHDIYIVTTSNYLSLKGKMENLLFKYFPFIKWDHVIITSNKQMIRGDVLVDDGVHNLEGGDYLKILMTAPHNRNYDAAANEMIRVDSWEDIYRVISVLEDVIRRCSQ